MGKACILLKTDQEFAIVCVQKAMQPLKSETVPINSPVGESACKGRVENTIRRKQEKFRVFRSQFEQGIGQRISDQSNIMAWMARWAAELLSKYTPEPVPCKRGLRSATKVAG